MFGHVCHDRGFNLKIFKEPIYIYIVLAIVGHICHDRGSNLKIFKILKIEIKDTKGTVTFINYTLKEGSLPHFFKAVCATPLESEST